MLHGTFTQNLMQASRLSGIPAVHSSFQAHRSSTDHPKFPLHLSLIKPTTSPGWGSLPTPPMSGTPPPAPLQLPPSTSAGRRRKRTDTPSEVITTSVSNAAPIISYQYDEPRPQRLHEPTMQVATQSVPYLPPLGYGIGPGMTVSHYSPPGLEMGPSQISPRTARRTKAHVASACINCKKKHLRCDNTRPCRRCVQGGKEDTCRDVEHKKRGRPPLKPEDSSSSITAGGRGRGPPSSIHPFPDSTGTSYPGEHRPYSTSAYPPILPSARLPLYPHHRGSSRSGIYTGLQSQYAQPSIAPSPMIATAGNFSYSARPQTMSFGQPALTLSPYGSQPQSLSSEAFARSNVFTNYSYGAYQPEASAGTPSYFPQPAYPREPTQITPQGETQTPLHGNIGIQLPPIRPTAYATNREAAFSPQMPVDVSPPHQVTPTYPAQSIPSGQHPRSIASSDEGRERDPKRPKMDIQGILGPRND